MTRDMSFARRAVLTMMLTAALAACSSAGGLPTALSQRMDAKGAVLDRAQALAMVNQDRKSVV